MSDITPRTNTVLIGHEEAESRLLGDFASGKLAHGWLISGPRGTGKATLAYRFARALLSGKPEMDFSPEDPMLRRIAAGSHSDLLVVEPAYDEKKGEYAREISVAQSREIPQFLSLTPGESQWRVVIVDAADALNTNAANALLKVLEEPPPQAVLLLLAHNPGRLLPTIRSRCRALRLKPLSRDQFIRVMRHVAPDTESEEMQALAALSALSPGVAIELREQEAVALYQDMLELLADFPSLDMLAVHGFAERVGTGKVHANWQVFTRLALCLLERTSLQAGGFDVEPASELEGTVLAKLAAAQPASQWAARWQQAADQFMVAERLHLDYKQCSIVFFHALAGKEEFQLGSAA